MFTVPATTQLTPALFYFNILIRPQCCLERLSLCGRGMVGKVGAPRGRAHYVKVSEESWVMAEESLPMHSILECCAAASYAAERMTSVLHCTIRVLFLKVLGHRHSCVIMLFNGFHILSVALGVQVQIILSSKGKSKNVLDKIRYFFLQMVPQ